MPSHGLHAQQEQESGCDGLLTGPSASDAMRKLEAAAGRARLAFAETTLTMVSGPALGQRRLPPLHESVLGCIQDLPARCLRMNLH